MNFPNQITRHQQHYIKTMLLVAFLLVEIFPPAFAKDEFVRDYQLLKAISPLLDQIEELHRTAERIYSAAAHDTMSGSLDVYDYVKQNKSKAVGVDAVADRMSVFFKKTRAKKS